MKQNNVLIAQKLTKYKQQPTRMGSSHWKQIFFWTPVW